MSRRDVEMQVHDGLKFAPILPDNTTKQHGSLEVPTHEFADALPSSHPLNSDPVKRCVRKYGLDYFLEMCYKYWWYQGRYSALLHRIVNVANSFFVAFIAILLGFRIDWDHVLSCDAATCSKASLFATAGETRFMGLRVVSVFISLAAIGNMTYHSLLAYKESVVLKQVDRFFVDTLKVLPASLPFITWGQVASRFTAKQSSGEENYTRLSSQPLEELTIAQMVLRSENYLTCMFCDGVLENGILPFCQNAIGFDTFLKTVVNQIITSERWNMEADQLRHIRRFVMTAAVLNIVLQPFVFSFFVVKTLVTTIAEVRSKPADLVRRTWTTNAAYQFREINEYDHTIEARLREALPLAESLLERSTAVVLSLCLRILNRGAAFLLAFILFLSLVNAPVLTYGTMANESLLWWFGIALSVYVATQSPPAFNRESPFEETMIKLAKQTHYTPERWNGHPANVVKELGRDFCPHRLTLLLRLLFSFIFSPVLLFLLALRGDELTDIVRYVIRHSTSFPRGGCIIDLSKFDAAAVEHRRDLQAKLDRSMVTFAAVHPAWVIPSRMRKFYSEHGMLPATSSVPKAKQGSKAGGSTTPSGSRSTSPVPTDDERTTPERIAEGGTPADTNNINNQLLLSTSEMDTHSRLCVYMEALNESQAYFSHGRPHH